MMALNKFKISYFVQGSVMGRFTKSIGNGGLISKGFLATVFTVSSMGSGDLMAEGAFMEAMKDGEVKFDFRYRIENVDDDVSGKKEANASTLKSRFTYTTGKWRDFQAQIEVDDLSEIGNDSFNSTKNGKIDYSVVKDPQGTEVNQAWIAYTGLSDSTIKHGRTRVLLDNQRFIGGVGWRQNEQTYDVTALINTSIKDTTVFLAHVRDIQGIAGDAVSTSSNLYNVNYKGIKSSQLTVYFYDLDNISKTKGIRLAGKPEVGGVAVHYELELASQQEEGLASSFDADYSHVVVGLTAATITAKVGRETQESDGGMVAFRTPLGTNHGFNGWADKFLTTPADGLEDTYFLASTEISDFNIKAVYHDFEAEHGSRDYGDELDISISKKVSKNVTVLGQYADYDGDGGKDSTRKLWMQIQAKF
jgi:hypothetical protein